MNKLCFFVFFISAIGFAQNLEETIYVATETFIANKNATSFKLLNTQETTFKNQVKTKDEQLALVFLQSHKGFYLDKNSKLEKAISTFEEALKRFNDNKLSKLSDFDIIESCLKPLADLYTKTDNYTNAKNTINQYIFLAKSNNNLEHELSGNINLAKLHQTLNDHKKVIKIIDEALTLANVTNSKKEKLIDIKIKSLVELNQLDKATSSLNDLPILSIFTKEKNNYIIQLKKENYTEALIAFNKAKTHLNEANSSFRFLAKMYHQEAQLYYILKDKTKAQNSLKQAIKTLLPNFNKQGLPNKNLLYAENTFIDISDLYAEIEMNPELALKSYDLSFYVSSLLKKKWTSQETKLLNVSANRNRSEKCIDILFHLYKQTQNKAFLFTAFEYSESFKTSILKEMAEKKLRLQHSPNDTLLIKEFKLLKEQNRLTNLLLEASNNEKINALSIQLNNISIKIKNLQPSISKKYTDKEYLFSLNKLQNKLSIDNAVLVEYFYGKHNLYQFIISDKDIILNQIPLNSKTEKTITNFNSLFNEASIINNSVSNYTKQAFNIYKLLNFNAVNTHKNVIIIPDSYLNFTPFEALLTHKTETTAFSKMPFVVKTQNIVYNTNIFLYLNKSEKEKNKKTLGFFPVFENTNQPLTYSINEAEAIKNEMSSNLYMYNEASKINFIKYAGNYGILHLSTHAVSHDGDNPANISFYDENLSIKELSSLDLNPELVILSACETGVGKSYKAEGAMSIARGFQYAGAENLLFSLWQINDLSTSQLMQSFYKNYNKYESAYTANHLSKIEYLENKSINNAKKSPYYWSAFVYYGQLTKPVFDYSLIYIFFGILIIVLIVLLIFKLKRHGRKASRFSS